VRTHRFDTNLRWRKGIFLTHNEYESEGILELVAPTRLHLAVRASQPNYLFTLLRDTAKHLFRERWPGLKYQEEIPCGGELSEGIPCLEHFTFAGLERCQEKNILILPCSECAKTHNVHELLTGFTPPSLPVPPPSLPEEVKAQLADIQAALRGMWQIMDAEVDDCPRLFTLEETGRNAFDPRRLGGVSYRLQLWCEHPGLRHPCGQHYTFNRPHGWIQSTASHLHTVAKILRPVLAIAGASPTLFSPMAESGASLERIEAAVTFMEEIGSAANAATAARKTPEAQGPDSNTEQDTATKTATTADGASLRQFRALLFEIDNNRKFSSLRRVRTPAGDTLWICPKHYPEYDPGLPTL